MRRAGWLLVVLLALPANAQERTIGFRGVGPICGDGNIDGGEVCDGSNFGADTCAAHNCTGGGSLTCAADCLSVTLGSCVDCQVLPNLFTEYFDGTNDPDAGYDIPNEFVQGSWVETGDVNPNEVAAGGCGTGTGWEGDCLEITSALFTPESIRVDLPAAHAKVCVRLYLRWTTEGFTGDGQQAPVFVGGSTAITQTSYSFAVLLMQEAGENKIKMAMSDGGSDVYPASGPITLPFQGRVEVCAHNSADADIVSWRVDGVQQEAWTGARLNADFQRMLIGPDVQYAATYYIDSLAGSDEGFIGDDPVGFD